MLNYIKKLKERVLKRKKIDKCKQIAIFIFGCFLLGAGCLFIGMYTDFVQSFCIQNLCSLFVK